MKLIYILVVILFFPVLNLSADSKRMDLVTNSSLEIGSDFTFLSSIKESATFPFLVGKGLLYNNSIKFTGGIELSPISVKLTTEAIFTPIAFLQLISGVSAGTGWDNNVATGLAINTPKDSLAMTDNSGDYGQNISDTTGVLWKYKGGLALQFDLAAVMPGKWNHIVFRSYHELNYQMLTGVSDNVSWVWAYQNTTNPGQSQNGWNYYNSNFIGYKMPVWLDMIGIFSEEFLPLYQNPSGTNFGRNLPGWDFGPLAEAKISSNFTLTTLFEGQTQLQYINNTGGRGFYQYRVVNQDNPISFSFYRVIAVLNYYF